MIRLLLPLTLLTTPLLAQIPIEDFETGTAFDLSGVRTYCNQATVQGSSDTHDASSLWSAEFSPFFWETCPEVASGLFLPLSGVAPGDMLTFTHWQKIPPNGGFMTNLVYLYPPTGSLPANEFQLFYVGPGQFHITTPDVWTSSPSEFTLPESMPWPADVYLLLHPTADEINNLTIRVDDVSMIIEGTTGTHMLTPADAAIRVAPLPAQDIVTISGLRADGGAVSVFNSAGARMHAVPAPQANGAWDVRALSPGVYLLRQDERVVRFIKG